jgi:dihydroorotase
MIVQKMCHAPADIFHVTDRGYLREGYWADLVLVDLNRSWEVQASNILAKCGWSPFEGEVFSGSIHSTLVNGTIVYQDNSILEQRAAQALSFDR